MAHNFGLVHIHVVAVITFEYFPGDRANQSFIPRMPFNYMRIQTGFFVEISKAV